MGQDLCQDRFSQPYAVGRLLFNADDIIVQFVSSRIDGGFSPNGEVRCVGVLDKEGLIIAGAVFHDFMHNNAMMSGATSRPGRWASRSVMAGIFAYAFDTLGLDRLTALVSTQNMASRKWVEQAGFRQEGAMRQAGSEGEDLILYGMLKMECAWHGQEQQDAAGPVS